MDARPAAAYHDGACVPYHAVDLFGAEGDENHSCAFGCDCSCECACDFL